MRFKLSFSGSLDDDVLWSLQNSGCRTERCRLLASIGILIDQGKVLPLNLANCHRSDDVKGSDEVNLMLKKDRDELIINYLSSIQSSEHNQALKERVRVAARVWRNSGSTGSVVLSAGNDESSVPSDGISDDVLNMIEEMSGFLDDL